jgi:hypothetical protein
LQLKNIEKYAKSDEYFTNGASGTNWLPGYSSEGKGNIKFYSH